METDEGENLEVLVMKQFADSFLVDRCPTKREREQNCTSSQPQTLLKGKTGIDDGHKASHSGN